MRAKHAETSLNCEMDIHLCNLDSCQMHAVLVGGSTLNFKQKVSVWYSG